LPVPDAPPLSDPDLGLLLAAAQDAGALARRRFGTPGRVWEKPDGQGLVTEADHEVDALLRARLTGARPDWGWMSEESDPLGDTARLGTETAFVVDPIDGTRAFAAGQKAFAHALAVVRAGQPVAAVVHLPMLELTYAAVRGGGAWLNGRRIAHSGRDRVPGARVLTSRASLDPGEWPGGAPAVDRHFRPSLAWRLALVGEGRFDAAITLRDAWDWDIAAAALVAAEAGATVTDRDGRALVFNTAAARNPGVMVAPPALHAALLRARATPLQRSPT